MQDTLQAVKHAPLSIFVGLKHRPGGLATHLFKIQHQHVVDWKVPAHTGQLKRGKPGGKESRERGSFHSIIFGHCML